MSFWSLVPIVGGMVERYQKGRAAKEDNRHAQEMATLTQFAAEFGHGRNWFDSLIDGFNRLPRPVMVGGMAYYFILSWSDPERFGIINAGLATIPDPMWYLSGIMVSFFFGARELAHLRKGKGFEAAARAAVDVVTSRKKTSEWLVETFPDVQLKAGVVVDGLNAEKMAPVIAAARNLYQSRGVPLVITSAIRPKSSKSLHDEGMALDFRSRTLSDPQAVTAALSTALGDDYDVIYEGAASGGAHIHVEYDPKGFSLSEMMGG